MKNHFFDSHFHLLFKHFISTNKNIQSNIKVDGLAQTLDELFGGPFDSQASPLQVSQSTLKVGITGLISMEHAFANRILQFGLFNLSSILPLDKQLVKDTKAGNRTYYDELNHQIQFYLDSTNTLSQAPYYIQYLTRDSDVWANLNQAEIEQILSSGQTRYLAFSMEGGHNLSNALIRKGNSSEPEKQLAQIQNRPDIDFLSFNLAHLSYIPEQNLGGFAQGLNKAAKIAFKSDDFLPQNTLGLTSLGKKVLFQALSHPTKPILVDVKHMSIYSRLDFYKYRNELIQANPQISRLPILCSHTGFTFTSWENYTTQKDYKAIIRRKDGQKQYIVKSENRLIGTTDDSENENLYANPWSIGLYDEEILAIMKTKGIIGISMDQRVLGASKAILDGQRGRYYEKEYFSQEEWQALFVQGKNPVEEWDADEEDEEYASTSTRKERHIMLLCCHLIYAARLGYAEMQWANGESPWDYVCIGSDFDGLINPLNGYDTMMDMYKLEADLYKYLPIADQYLVVGKGKGLKYNADGSIDTAFLDEVIAKVLFNNGLKFIARFLKNWH